MYKTLKSLQVLCPKNCHHQHVSFSTSLTPLEYKSFHFANAESVLQRFHFRLMIQTRKLQLVSSSIFTC